MEVLGGGGLCCLSIPNPQPSQVAMATGLPPHLSVTASATHPPPALQPPLGETEALGGWGGGYNNPCHLLWPSGVCGGGGVRPYGAPSGGRASGTPPCVPGGGTARTQQWRL